MRTKYPNILIVEGNDDKFSVIGLMKHHVLWSDEKNHWPVFIDVGCSASEILQKGYLTAQAKASHIQTLGVMLDADEEPHGRYQRVREIFSELFPNLPAKLSMHGVISDNEDQKRLGIWLMPDNSARGGLETFLKYLVPDTNEALWKHAVESTVSARNLGAACRDCHVAKAELYTWLSWQDPPGYSPGVALTKKILDPSSEGAAIFVKWFKELYRLELAGPFPQRSI